MLILDLGRLSKGLNSFSVLEPPAGTREMRKRNIWGNFQQWKIEIKHQVTFPSAPVNFQLSE